MRLLLMRLRNPSRVALLGLAAGAFTMATPATADTAAAPGPAAGDVAIPAAAAAAAAAAATAPIRDTSHHNPAGGFQNPWPSYVHKSVWQYFFGA